jgi:hypothetical protein
MEAGGSWRGPGHHRNLYLLPTNKAFSASLVVGLANRQVKAVAWLEAVGLRGTRACAGSVPRERIADAGSKNRSMEL